ncbi:alpha-N-arabinofuranosidase [Phnomibacter ginsenosidimutans]|uniref:non-reducing end alpha-L-arabinofuranosidase n=1 Tax=Phnomibacter ginsenosidimutans TaxID=2676868 RepID=A0A6I6G5R0_9BACT|nr:alpha-L-arabinofuranosidase C-terminal domain-containing protein [Phnomibacter ginsenosidimutans]QGW27557.1 alpha-N-arabinofuranosidase [Phnomibacter ginsenosidimutans]
MKKLVFTVAVAFLSGSAAIAQHQVLLQPAKATTTISRHIYGHFAEHLGRCIYDGIYVGDTNKVIPNTDGVRNDIIAALQQLKVPNLRWPGGCFADTYHWKDGVGPKANRPSIVNRWWGGVTEDNSFGTHDFLNLCERIGAEPYLAGNVGSGTVQELSDWVQYVSAPANASPMSKWRAQNGREKPWSVKYWGVGNEVWGCGGNMTPEYYANIYKQYATFMSSWNNDDKIFRVASGANGDNYHWTEVMMRDIPHHMLEGVGVHHYAVINWNKKGSATQFTEADYFNTMKSALYMEELVTKHAAVMDKYDPKKKVAMLVDEWGGWYDVEPGTNPGFLYQQNTMRDAMIAGATLNIFNNHADRVRMANLAQTVNVLQAVILTKGAKMILTPTYHVMQMYNVHQDATLIPVQAQTATNYTLGAAQLPAISISASKNKAGVTHISLVNIDATKSNTVKLNVDGATYKKVSGQILTAASLQTYNDFDAPNRIQPAAFNGARLNGNSLEVTMPPLSVVVLAVNE